MSWPETLQRVHGYGLVAIFAGFLALVDWSSFIARRFSLNIDYSFYGQAWFLIAHGHFNPYSTSGVPSSFWHNAFELVMWPLAAFWYVWPHTVTLLWIQDAATAGCAAIIFVWICEATARVAGTKDLGPWLFLLPVSGLVLLMANPWTIWIDTFDFHPQSIDLFFALIAAHAFWRGHARRGWIAALLALFSGAIGATYVAGLGLTTMLAGPKWRRLGLVLFVLGISWLFFVSSIGGDHASGVYANLTRGSNIRSVTALNLLKSLIEHPSRAISAIWSVRKDIFADVSGGGIIGFFSPWAFGVSFLVLLEGSLTGSAQFVAPGVQNSLPLFFLIPLGTVMVLIALATSRHQWKRVVALALMVLTVVNVFGWTLTWSHRTESQWVSVPPATASVLSRTLSMIHTNDEVIASEGIVGSFSFRQWVYPLIAGPSARFPIHSRTVWFVITPGNGIETESTTEAESQIGQIAENLHARLISDQDGVYVFKWRPGTNRKSVVFTDAIPVPAWTLNAISSQAVLKGPATHWHLQSRNYSAFIVSGDYWRLQNGTYSAKVRYSSKGSIQIYVVDTSLGKVLAKETFSSTAGAVETRSFTGTVINVDIPHAYSGFGIFSVEPVQPPAQDILELELMIPGGSRASIYSISLSNQNGGP
jgi:hypothetical protein